MPQLVITAVGPDRPGLVGDFAAQIYSAGLNLADSRMVNLRGQFALISLVEGPEVALAEIRQALPRAADRIGLTVTFGGDAGPWKPHAGVPYRIKTYSMDQPGIVHRVTSLLREHGVNIEDLETHLDSGPFMGSPLFTMELHVTVPQQTPVTKLRRELEAACEALNCDVDVEPA